MKRLLLTICFFVSLCAGVRLPHGFKKCDRNQRDFNECMITSVENAIKQLTKPIKKFGLPSLEPLEIRNIFVEPGSGVVAFEQNFTYLNIFELTKVTVKKFDINFTTNSVVMECFFPEVKYEFEFSFNGTAVGVPIYGKGIGKVTMEKATYNMTFTLEEFIRSGKKYYKVVDGKLVITLKNAQVKLEGLYDGDQKLEEQINKIMNDNWEVIIDQGKGSYEVILGKYFSAMFNNVLARIPISELFGSAEYF